MHSSKICLTVLLVPSQLTHLAPIDILILVLCFSIVISIGFYVKGSPDSSEQFFLAGREMSVWVVGLSIVSANFGSLQLMGWAGAAVPVRHPCLALVLDWHHSRDAIWFFIGGFMLICGLVLTIYGAWESFAKQELATVLHTPHFIFWWGFLMLLSGLFYTIKFRPHAGEADRI